MGRAVLLHSCFQKPWKTSTMYIAEKKHLQAVCIVVKNINKWYILLWKTFTSNIYCCMTSHKLEDQPYLLSQEIVFFPYNSLTPWRFQWNLRKIIFKLILMTDGCDISSEIALRWTSLDHNDDKSTLVQVMAWCHQAASHYLSQCWPRSLSPYGVIRPQWVKQALSSQVYSSPNGLLSNWISLIYASTVWYKTKVGSQNFGYQL